LHNRYLNEEISELNDASLQKEAGGTDWDAGGSKIKNVGAPTLTADATTKQYVDDKVNQLSSGASAPPTKWVFTGDAGANTTYSVTGAEVNGDTAYDVSVDGSVLEPTTDYTVDPDTDTLTIVNTLSGGEDIVVIERGFGVAITGTIGADQLQSNAVTTAKLADHSVTAVKISNTDSKFNVQTDGKVGIGTASPDAKLEIVDSSNHLNLKVANTISQSVLKFSDSDGLGGLHLITDGTALPSNGALNIDSEGNVGLGTANTAMPSGKGINIYDTNVARVNLKNSTTGDGVNDGITMSLNANGDFFIYNKEATGLIQLGTNSTTHVTLDENGNLGIGTVSPSAPLEVSSTTGGVVFPRLTTAQRDAISTPTDGETIFNTTTNVVESWNGSGWISNGVSKYTTGWTNISSTLANDTEFTFTHNLGTTDILVNI
jgi:hypothetical protein